jgi:ATP-binding cassette subfamily B multidrug efflux pump
MFRFFEQRIEPFPADEPAEPPRGLLAFLLHYSKPVLPWLALMSLLTASLSVVEVTFFGFIGSLVDWLAQAERETFWAEHGARLALYGALVVVSFPLISLVQSMVVHQTIFGNYPMLVRWLGHRYLLRQSLKFYQDEFAGRVSQKLMQTALAIRETVMKLMDVFVYVIVYFTGALVLIGQADLRLAAPLVLWLGAYLMLLVFFVPRLRDIAMAQADARAHMTGRIVDTYTNIQTIKLFAHAQREQDYARRAMSEFMSTVYRQMRLVTWLTVCLQTVNILLLVAVAAVAIYAWQQAAISLGAIAVSIALVMRIRAMSNWILWEVAGLFENVGTVQDGINTLAQPLAIVDGPGAAELVVPRGEIRFDRVSFHYGRESGSSRASRSTFAPARGSVSSGARAPASRRS